MALSLQVSVQCPAVHYSLSVPASLSNNLKSIIVVLVQYYFCSSTVVVDLIATTTSLKLCARVPDLQVYIRGESPQLIYACKISLKHKYWSRALAPV
jgi:hypothetical protein